MCPTSTPVIPGSTEKMGHFFSADPESTAVIFEKKDHSGEEFEVCPHFFSVARNDRRAGEEFEVCPTMSFRSELRRGHF